MPLPPCRWRGPVTEGRAPCSSPKLITAPTIPVEVCYACYYCDHAPPPGHGAQRELPCIHLGGNTGERRVCSTCRGSVSIKLRACAVHGTCTLRNMLPDVRACAGCADYTNWLPPEVVPIDSGRLLPGRCFNPSLIVHGGRRLLAYRQEWSKARIRIAELDDDWQPLRNYHTEWGGGPEDPAQEDPRLFTFRGQLHCGYTSYDGCRASVGIVRFHDDLSVERAWLPALAGRQPWEKNWAWFEWEEQLHAIYSPRPHVVLRLDGDRADRAFESPNPIPWRWGEMRGGAPPVRLRGEFWHFFHSSLDLDHRRYALGVYTFEAQPPFRILRYCPWPLVQAQPEDRPGPGMPVCVYPGGAVLDGDHWRIAAGYMDTSCRLYRFDHGQIERALVVV